MGSLTHVCVWSSKGWTHIAPEEVARSHLGESVSARSGFFMCELCGQSQLEIQIWKGEIPENTFFAVSILQGYMIASKF